MRGTHGREFAWRELEVEHAAIRGLIDALTDEQMTRRDTIDYGLFMGQELSFKDLLAHLMSYEELSLAALADWRAGKKHWAIDTLQNEREAIRVHFEGIAARKPHPLAQVIGDWQRFQAEIVREIREMSDTEWKSPPPFANSYPLDLSGVFEIIICAPPRPPYRHLPVHIPNIDKFLQKMRIGG